MKRISGMGTLLGEAVLILSGAKLVWAPLPTAEAAVAASPVIWD
jgi:hypothetical protein